MPVEMNHTRYFKNVVTNTGQIFTFTVMNKTPLGLKPDSSKPIEGSGHSTVQVYISPKDGIKARVIKTDVQSKAFQIPPSDLREHSNDTPYESLGDLLHKTHQSMPIPCFLNLKEPNIC